MTIKPNKQKKKSNDFSLEGSPSTYRKEPELKGPQKHVGRPCGFQGKAKKKKKKKIQGCLLILSNPGV